MVSTTPSAVARSPQSAPRKTSFTHPPITPAPADHRSSRQALTGSRSASAARGSSARLVVTPRGGTRTPSVISPRLASHPLSQRPRPLRRIRKGGHTPPDISLGTGGETGILEEACLRCSVSYPCVTHFLGHFPIRRKLWSPGNKRQESPPCQQEPMQHPASSPS